MHWTLRTFVLLSGIRLDEKLAWWKVLLDRQVDRNMFEDLPISPEPGPFEFLNRSHCWVCRLCLGQDYVFGNVVKDCWRIQMGIVGLLWCFINNLIFLWVQWDLHMYWVSVYIVCITTTLHALYVYDIIYQLIWCIRIDILLHIIITYARILTIMILHAITLLCMYMYCNSICMCMGMCMCMCMCMCVCVSVCMCV